MVEKARYFKVSYGYKALDYVSVPEGAELEKAIYAMISRHTVSLGDTLIQGRNILHITPHYHRYTGWWESYQPKSGDDWRQIERDCPSFNGVFEDHVTKVKRLVQKNQTEMIGTGETNLSTYCPQAK